MKIVPMSEMVLITEPEQQEKTAGGIIVPEMANKKNNIGKVIRVGSDEELSKMINIDDEILFNPQGVDSVEVENKKYKVVHKLNILAVLKKEK